MYSIIGILGFLLYVPKVIRAIRAESKVYDEFGQRKVLPLLLLPFPLAPIGLLVLPHLMGWVPAAVIAAMCFLPAFVMSRKHINAFECSGTSRTDAALKSAHMAFGGALVGLVYVGIFVTLVATAID